MDQIKQKLSSDLQAIYDHEIAEGNSVLRVDEPAGTLCPLAIVFVKPLNRSAILADINLDSSVTWHMNDDPHYEVNGMAGFTSSRSRQFVYGPIGKQ